MISFEKPANELAVRVLSSALVSPASDVRYGTQMGGNARYWSMALAKNVSSDVHAKCLVEAEDKLGQNLVDPLPLWQARLLHKLENSLNLRYTGPKI